MNPVIVYLYSTANLSHPFQVNEGNYSSCHDIIPHFNTHVHPREERGKGKTGACPLLEIYELHRREIIETKNVFNLQLFSYVQQRNISSEINMWWLITWSNKCIKRLDLSWQTDNLRCRSPLFLIKHHPRLTPHSVNNSINKHKRQ